MDKFNTNQNFLKQIEHCFYKSKFSCAHAPKKPEFSNLQHSVSKFNYIN